MRYPGEARAASGVGKGKRTPGRADIFQDMNILRRIQSWWKGLWSRIKAETAQPMPRPAGRAEGAAVGSPLSWDECTKACCWFGGNAGTRVMNILSPHFTETQFEDRVRKCADRGCNTFHLFLANKADGEGAGFWPDEARLDRVETLWDRGYGLVLWLIADDSADYWKAICRDPAAFIAKCRPFLPYASTVVLGLEMDEYGSRAQWQALREALRREYAGKIGVHHTSGKTTFLDLGDILFYQVSPGKSAGEIRSAAKSALGHGKPVCFFELDRHENRELAQAALDAGCYAVGNW